MLKSISRKFNFEFTNLNNYTFPCKDITNTPDSSFDFGQCTIINKKYINFKTPKHYMTTLSEAFSLELNKKKVFLPTEVDHSIFANYDPKNEIFYNNTCIRFKINYDAYRNNSARFNLKHDDETNLKHVIAKIILDYGINYYYIDMSNHTIGIDGAQYASIRHIGHDGTKLNFYIHKINNEEFCYIVMPIFVFI